MEGTYLAILALLKQSFFSNPGLPYACLFAFELTT